MSDGPTILVVQTAFLGDVVLTTSLLRELRRLLPGSRILLVATPLGAATMLGSPLVDEILVYDKKGPDRGLRGVHRLVRRLRRSTIDIAVAAQRSARTGLLVRLSGAPRRIGFRGAAGAWAYTDRVPWRASRHAAERYADLAAPLRAEAQPPAPRPELTVREAAAHAIDRLLEEEGIAPEEPILAIAPGSVWGTKRWAASGYAAVVRETARFGLAPVLVGSPDEKPLCDRIAAASGRSVPVLAGRTGVAELTALLARSRALVTNDSGPGHVAAAVGTPVVAIFGPTVPAFGYTPYGGGHRIVEIGGLECRPCDRHGPQVCPLGHHRCMEAIDPATVLAALGDVLASPRKPRDHA